MYAARRRQRSVRGKFQLGKLGIGQQFQLFDNPLRQFPQGSFIWHQVALHEPQFVDKKEMFSWIACSNSSNRAQEKNAASVIARVQELVLLAIRSCVITREHMDRHNKKVSPTR